MSVWSDADGDDKLQINFAFKTCRKFYSYIVVNTFWLALEWYTTCYG